VDHHPQAAPADRRPRFDAEAEPARALETAELRAVRVELSRKLIDRALLEKVLLIGLVATIFGQVIPSLDATPLALADAVVVLVITDAAISEWFQRRRSGDLPGRVLSSL
jgi:hypothetical protein